MVKDNFFKKAAFMKNKTLFLGMITIFIISFAYFAFAGFTQGVLISPADNSWNTDGNVTFSCSFNVSAPDDTIVNVSLYTNMTGSWGINTTNGTAMANAGNLTYVFDNISIIPDGIYVWNCLATDNGTGPEEFWASSSTNYTIKVDQTAPTVLNVNSTNDDETYKAGEEINVTVTFSEAVDVTGDPKLELELGDTDRNASYLTGTGTTILTFNYTILAGDNSDDLNYTSTSALTAGTSIKDAAGNDATRTLPEGPNSLAGNKDIIIDTTAPTILNVSSTNDDGAYKAGEEINITVTFSEVVIVDEGTEVPILILELGAIDRDAIYIGGNGTTILTFNYTVQLNDTSSDLDYINTTALILNDSTIKDEVEHNANLTLASPGAVNSLSNNTAIIIDTTAPTPSNIGKNNTNIKINDVVEFQTLWEDSGSGTNYSIFSWNNTGSWVNQTSPGSLGGSSSWSNISDQKVTKTGGTVIGWMFYANDSAGNWNNTGIQIFTVNNTALGIAANATSPANVYTNTDWQANLTVTDADSADTLTGYVQFYINGVSSGSEQSLVVSNGTNTNVANLSSLSFNKSETLTAEYWAGDGTINTTKLNMSVIVLNSAPTVAANITSPSPVYTNTNFMLNLTVVDVDSSDTITGYVQFYVNDTASDSVQSQTVPSGTNTLVATLGNGNFSKSDNLIVGYWAGDGTINTSKYNTTVVTVSSSTPTIQVQNTFINCSIGHCFNVTAGIVDIDGGSDIVATNISTSIGTCTHLINTTSGNYFNVTFNCSHTILASSSIMIGFTDAGSNYAQTSSSTNTYPNQLPSQPTITNPAHGYANNVTENVTMNWTASTDTDGDTVNYHVTVNGTQACYTTDLNCTYETSAVQDYVWNVTPYDGSQNGTTSTSRTFSYDLTRPIVTAVSSSGETSSGATLTATTDENATCAYSTTDINYTNMTDSFTTTGTISHSTAISGLSASTSYPYYVRCIDIAGNTMNFSNSTTITTTAATTTPGGSSSSGGTVSYTSVSEQGTSIILRKGYIKTFTLNGKYHTIKGVEIGEDYATFQVASTPVTITLKPLEFKKLDFDNDNYYDLYIKLDEINNSKAYLTLKHINESITAEAEETPEEVPEETPEKVSEETPEEPEEVVPPEEEPTAKLTWLWILVVLIIIGLAAYFFVYKKKK